MTQEKITIEHNSCLLSSSLLDELDYFIGGYGDPSIEFIFNFNSFLESFVLSSNFILSKQEFDHINITKTTLFPNGRPVFELFNQPNIRLDIFQGLGNKLMRCIHVENIKKPSNKAVKSMIAAFAKKEPEKIKETLILSDLSTKIESVTTFNVGFGKEQMMIGETFNRPLEIVQTFFNSINNYNIQAALPVFTFKQQIEELNKKAISKDIYETLCFIQGQKVNNAEKYLGNEIQTIPPLVNIVLSKCKNREDIPKVMLEIRNDFTKYRECCEQHEKNLMEAQTVKEQLEAIDEFKEFWTVLVKKYSDGNSRLLYRFVDVAKESNIENSVENSIDSLSTESLLKDLNLVKVAGKIGGLAFDRIKQKRILNRFKGVTNLWSLIDGSPALNLQLNNIERVFDVQLDQGKLATVKKYMSEIKTEPNTM